MKPTACPANRSRGFALVISLSLMVLLTVLAVGLLSLSSLSLRSGSRLEAKQIADANARMAVMLAIGQLQKSAGDDRRVTVDGSIFEEAKHPHAVGVWKSWSPKLAENPTAAASYESEKASLFVTWLTSSGRPSDLSEQDWAKSGTLGKPLDLFSEKSDGFVLAGSKIELDDKAPTAGALAWAVVQDATRAKINVGGPENDDRDPNDDLQAQPRPSLAASESFKQPGGEWNKRTSLVISMGQAMLDEDLWKKEPDVPEGAHFTAHGLGLLTDVVNGGFKTDLSLGFEMPESDFKKDKWGDFKNPFRAANAPALKTPASYRGERPLFRPLTDSGSVRVDVRFPPANTTNEFPAAAVPTFATLRSFYRTPFHVYQTDDGPTIFERGMDHVALKKASPSGDQFPAPGASPLALKSQTGYRPVLDRILYVMSAGLGPANEVRLIVTPVVTLWNPYNVALEIEGAVAYPWVDLPLRHNWKFYSGSTLVKEEQAYRGGHGFGALFASQFPTTARTVNPFFFAALTPGGSQSLGAGKSIRFAPGEVRVFAPADPVAKTFLPQGSIRERTLYLRPVESPDQFSFKGGFTVPTRNEVRGAGFTRVLGPNESVEVTITPMNDQADAGNYWNTPFNVGLEDATRLKLANPKDGDRGQSIGDVQTVNFISSGAAASYRSPRLSFAELSNPDLRKPFGMFETYHRVASDAALSRRSDLVFTTNPRQSFVNSYLTTGSFVSAPHYETKMRGLDSANQVMETKGGRSAFYGASNSAGSGRTHLSFFEAPQAALLSLAGFQHADLSGTSYSPANQFGNSWASAYLKRDNAALKISPSPKKEGEATVSIIGSLPVYDHCYLANESMWDSFFFSGAASSLKPGSATGSPGVWDSEVAKVSSDYRKTLKNFIDNPAEHPLRNPRMLLHVGREPAEDLKEDLLKPEGCLRIAANLHLDGAFNINSTSEKAWTAYLSGMKNGSFAVAKDPSGGGGSSPDTEKTAFPRFRNPIGAENDDWMGFRSLTDAQIAELAEKLVAEVKARGPFLSLGEFVNRRVENSELGLKGAIQAAIDRTGFNDSALYDTFNTAGYPADGKPNITPANTGVGIPGYLTQADVLQSIAPAMTARSDTFTIRGYGEAKDSTGKILATSWCEAVVQRNPEFVDETDEPHTPVAELNAINQAFGRKFQIVSFRHLARHEVGL